MDAYLMNQGRDNEKKIKGHRYQSHTILECVKGLL